MVAGEEPQPRLRNLLWSHLRGLAEAVSVWVVMCPQLVCMPRVVSRVLAEVPLLEWRKCPVAAESGNGLCCAWPQAGTFPSPLLT